MSKYNKGWVGLVGGLLSYWSTFASSTNSHWFPLVLSLLTAAGVVAVPNKTP